MKSNKLDKNIKFNSINLTAYRAIKIFKMLLEKPCSNHEIIENLQKDEITSKSISDDTLRATLNSLKSVGCDISRPSPNNNYKYVLNSHPFGLRITSKQVNIMISIRQDFLLKNDWQTVLAINDLYEKIAKNFQDKKLMDLIISTEPFLEIRPEVINFIRKKRIEGKDIIMNYATSRDKQNLIEVKADKIFCYCGKIYLCGWYYKRNKYAYFNAEKIRYIEGIEGKVEKLCTNFYKARYKIYGNDSKTFRADEEETVIKREENFIIVEYEVKSEFKFFQRLLNFGENFELIEPIYLRKVLLNKINNMLERYRDDKH